MGSSFFFSFNQRATCILGFINHGKGRYIYTTEDNFHEYVINDHEGSARIRFMDKNGDKQVSIDPADEEVVQENHYYPFGMNLEGTDFLNPLNPKNRYRYTGQEKIDEGDLGWYDYGARWYDPSVGRMMQVDPMAEYLYGHTPYNSMLNNPIRFTDPNGDFLPQLIGAVVGGTVNLVSQALQGNVTSFGEGLAYFGVGAVAGVMMSVGQVGAARATTAIGNKGVQLVTGKLKPSDINSPGDLAMLAVDVALDIGTPDLAYALAKPITKRIGARFLASALDDAIVGGGGSIIKNGGAIGDIAFSVTLSDDIVVTASKIRAWPSALEVSSMVGKTGEKLVKGIGPKGRIPSLTGTAKYRIPDGLTATTLSEIKNVKHLNYTSQLKDFHLFAKSQNPALRFDLYTRSTTTFSSSLKNLFNNGEIFHHIIPGL